MWNIFTNIIFYGNDSVKPKSEFFYVTFNTNLQFKTLLFVIEAPV